MQLRKIATVSKFDPDSRGLPERIASVDLKRHRRISHRRSSGVTNLIYCSILELWPSPHRCTVELVLRGVVDCLVMHHALFDNIVTAIAVPTGQYVHEAWIQVTVDRYNEYVAAPSSASGELTIVVTFTKVCGRSDLIAATRARVLLEAMPCYGSWTYPGSMNTVLANKW